MKHFEAIIIGTSQGDVRGGAIFGSGKTVAIIERHKFVSTCANKGHTDKA